jgi:hypothetical protein
MRKNTNSCVCRLGDTQNIVSNSIDRMLKICQVVLSNWQFCQCRILEPVAMAPSQNQHDTLLGDPIELVTQFVTNQDWLLQRRAENAVLVEVPGKWCDYQLAVTWRHNEQAMQVTCRIDIQFDESYFGKIALLAALLNQQIFMGHLALDVGTGELELRHTLPLRGAGGATPEQIEDVVDIMLGECEYCFPAIYQVARNQLSPNDAAIAASFATEGEA